MAGPSKKPDIPNHRSQPYTQLAVKEARRIRGEIACAECRRLKIRCDRQVPCSTCITRGCAALCPNGTVPPGDNSRFVSAAKDHLQTKLTKLEDRMRALEDALAILHATDSDQPHPLLAQPFVLDPDVVELDDPPNVEEITDSFGSLHMDADNATARFFGPTGGAESLLRDNKSCAAEPPPDIDDPLLDMRSLGLPEELTASMRAFPFTPVGVPTTSIRATIEVYLPSPQRAAELCDIFLEHLSWMFHIVSRQQLRSELLPAVYRQRGESELCGAHDLALLLIVFAIGALVDLSLPAYNSEARRYYVLARTAACMQPVLTTTSLATIKFLHLLSIYNGMSGKEINVDNSYTLVNVACRMSQAIGLHVDPSVWNMDPKLAYERRAYFWNLRAADTWNSLCTGRPPVLTESYTSCRHPTDIEEQTFQQGEVPIGFGTWGFRYTTECIQPVIKLTHCTYAPRYDAVLDLDRKIRAYVPPKTDEPAHETMDPRTMPVSASMRLFARSHYEELILLFLHRGFFAKAMAERPDNPGDTPYRHSFVTSYQCACTVLRSTAAQFVQQPQLLSRVWQIWTFAFSSAVIVGAVAMHVHQFRVEPSALDEFERACQLFKSASQTNSRAARALPVLLNMYEKAFNPECSSNRRAQCTTPPDGTAGAENDDEVAIFGGKTRLVPMGVREPAMEVPIPSFPPGAPFAPDDLSSHPSSHSSSVNVPQPPLLQPPHIQRLSARNTRPLSGSYGDTQVGFVDSDYYALMDHPELGQKPEWGLLYAEHSHDYTQAAADATPSDFVLDETWTSFMQQYGALGTPGQPPM